mmetsp:Transcript_38440/g.62219  ORF Transcript_38440/g.62219 Transcript_38440/m.62219 type:complete len:86 (-) Transcript_38440:14-271(-)
MRKSIRSGTLTSLAKCLAKSVSDLVKLLLSTCYYLLVPTTLVVVGSGVRTTDRATLSERAADKWSSHTGKVYILNFLPPAFTSLF